MENLQEKNMRLANTAVANASGTGTAPISSEPENTFGYSSNMVGINPNPQVITSDISKSVSPVTLPNTPVSSAAQAVSGVVDGVKTAQQALDQQNQAQSEAAKSKEASSATDTRSIIEQIVGLDAEKAAMETEAKIAEKSQLVTNVTNQIEASQRAQTNELRAIQNNPELDGAGIAARTQSINRKYAFEQADLALIQSAANRDYTTAQNIIDKKIALKLEGLKAKLDYYKEINAGDKSAYTEAQKNTLKNLETKASNELKKAEEFEKTKSDFAMQALKDGNTNLFNSINKATTQDEIFSTIAKSGGDINSTVESQLYSGLKTPTATAVRSQVGAFKGEDTVKTFTKVQEGYNFANSLPNNTKNPVDDQALVYAFAKIMDPESVVREGEYNTVQKYAQSWVKAYGKGVENAISGTGFLSEDARKNIKKTIESRYSSKKASYENLRKNYAKSIDSLTGRKDGLKFVTDYNMEFMSESDPLNLGLSGIGNNPLNI